MPFTNQQVETSWQAEIVNSFFFFLGKADLATHRDGNDSFGPVLSSQRAIKQAPTSSLVNGIIILHSRRYVGVFCIDIQSRSNIDFVDHSILTELLSKGYRTCNFVI